MKINKTNRKLLNIFALSALLPVLLTLREYQPVYAQSVSNNLGQEIRTLIEFKAQEEPPDSSDAGGARGVLQVVSPPANQLLLTTKAKPTVFIYIGKNDVQNVNLILQDQETQEVIYETTISVSGKPGVIELRFPSDSPSLEVGKTYIFGISSLQDNALELVSGKMQRVELNQNVISQLESANPLEQAILYAENGIWFDTLEILAELKRSQPENEVFATEWKELLRSVGLNDIATKPLID